MANARTRYDNICEYLTRSHAAQRGSLFGKSCLLIRNQAFMAWCFDGVGFRIAGRSRLQALALPGARFWDPMERQQPEFGWVYIPETQFLRWDRYAIEAARQAEAAPRGGSAFGPRAEAAPSAEVDPEKRAVRELKPSGMLSRMWSLVPLMGR